VDDSQGASSSHQALQQDQEGLNPGQVGFISRARVPKPSTRAYVNRPVSSIEGQFHGPSKAKSTSRLDVALREFQGRTKAKKPRRHVGVNIAGTKM
jgi:transcription factor SPN1